MRWNRNDLPGALAAWAVAVSALMVVVNPTELLRAALAILAPMVVLVAFLSSIQQGSCPRCHTSRRHQRRSVGEPTVVAASRTETSESVVGVSSGWEVDVPVYVECQKCAHHYRTVSSRFIPRTQAGTASEAALLAGRDMV
jgi:hypothetical protein